jgi:fructose-1,6-bisphosphatase I
MVVEQAGGYASDGHGPILELKPKELHQRIPLYIGSRSDVKIAEAFISGKRNNLAE